VTPARDDHGNITLFTCVAAFALFLIVGLVADGGAQLRAAQNATALAEEAGRAASQAIDASHVMQGGDIRVDPAAAADAAEDYLAAARVEGTVVSTTATTVTIQVRDTRPTVLLSLVGIDSLTATGEATAHLMPAG
jgi:Flp pilus assembly protein TadG